MLDHALERPGLGALLQAQRRIEIEAVFALDMGTDEGGIGDAFRAVLDIGQLPLRRGRRHGLFLDVSKARHAQLHLGLGDERAHFRQAKPGAKAK